MNATLEAWNHAEADEALRAVLACCGAERWSRAVVALRPFVSVDALRRAADACWAAMEESDWLEAFACHPRIGQRAAAHATGQSAAWSVQEQSGAAAAQEQVLAELAAGNAAYEKRFGFTYIVCATGKTAEEMLGILNRRLASDRATELREAAAQQRLIMQIRLGKWLTP